MILYIDTRDSKKIIVFLKKEGKVMAELSKQNEYGSQVLLPLILRLLKTVNCNLKTLKGIEVETGPGSFTGLRVGVSVANALAYSLNIPVNGKKIEADLVY
ncbi:tRNA (adenosine(37)-N6)-threonylcarbamoyltransferase complex dimerization subunit type 1 TsaB [Candidatus Daviesbacteria bacterium]|nr:tRNA (adenosine(37)-N6)-threonylcarbamoyltransferase complex dimerization subunit type 1 TsaB [Candidatus Daviesbacteria bacterium]